MRQLALNDLTAKVLVAAAAARVEEKLPRVQSEFYSQALYEGKLLAEILPALSVPPPVYQSAPQLIQFNEKLEDVQKEISPISSIPSSASSATELANGHFWDGYEDDVLPEKSHGKYLRNLRHQVFSLYRRLFGVVFVVNMAILISLFVKGGTNAQELGLIVVANLFCAILMRQDYVINAFFTVFCAVPASYVLRPFAFCACLTSSIQMAVVYQTRLCTRISYRWLYVIPSDLLRVRQR